mmetsp:Transcript_71834/g.171664  ORF Transcript_71834/g.171664 Transcript_71834/m.171664 type:complete len:80 (+) Transcript_71834:193-432(+)
MILTLQQRALNGKQSQKESHNYDSAAVGQQFAQRVDKLRLDACVAGLGLRFLSPAISEAAEAILHLNNYVGQLTPPQRL